MHPITNREREKEIRKKNEEEELRQKTLREAREREIKAIKEEGVLLRVKKTLSQQEQCAREEVKAADELLQDAKSKQSWIMH